MTDPTATPNAGIAAARTRAQTRPDHVGPWRGLSARTDPYNLGGIAVEGPGAPIVRDAITALYDRVVAAEKARDDALRHLSPPFTIGELSDDLERFNRADPTCEACHGMGRTYLGREEAGEVHLDPVPCRCTEAPR